MGRSRRRGPAGGDLQNKVNHARIMADGKYTKLYINGVRVANAPQRRPGPLQQGPVLCPGYDQRAPGDAHRPDPRRGGWQETLRRARREGPRRDPGDLLRHGERRDPPGVGADAEGDRHDAEGPRRPQAHHRGPHRQRGQRRVQPGAEREAGGGGAPVPDRQLPDRRRAGWRPRAWVRPSRSGPNDSPEGRQQNRRVELVKK